MRLKVRFDHCLKHILHFQNLTQTPAQQIYLPLAHINTHFSLVIYSSCSCVEFDKLLDAKG